MIEPEPNPDPIQSVEPAPDTPPATSDDVDKTTSELVDKLLALTAESDRLEAALAAVSAEAGRVKAVLLDQFLSAGFQSIKHAEGTVFLSTRNVVALARADGETPAEAEARVAGALERAGLGHLIRPRVDVAGIKSAVADMKLLNAGGDPFLEGLLVSTPIQDIRVRRR